jgi:hypothetical protein
VYQQLLILQNPRDFTLPLELSAGTINDNDAAPTVATITPASATEGSPAVFEFIEQPLLLHTTIPLHSPMEPLEVLITLPLRKQYLRCYYGNCICTYNCDTIADLYCLWNGFGYWNNQ